MVEDKIRLNREGGSIAIQNGKSVCVVRQAVDDDILLSTPEEEMKMELSLFSMDNGEVGIYLVFEKLMKTIIGKYMLEDYGKYSSLPEDFINLENRTIIWHSDGGTDNIFKLSYDENTINIVIKKANKATRSSRNVVRIRTNGSDYGFYYQEFIDFYHALVELEGYMNRDKAQGEKEVENSSYEKRLSIRY